MGSRWGVGLNQGSAQSPPLFVMTDEVDRLTDEAEVSMDCDDDDVISGESGKQGEESLDKRNESQ